MSDYPSPYPPVNNFVGGNPQGNVVQQPPNYGFPNPAAPQGNVVQQPPSYGFLNPAALDNNEIKASQYLPQVGGNPVNSAVSYGAPPMIGLELNQIEEYTAWSVINILCCCFFLGLLACFYSIETDNAKKRGDIQSAINASRNARTINIMATVLGIIVTTIVVLLRVGAF